ncbi:MAG TPA: hypothetical protein DCL38_02815 [Lachnospiraceae bacterium]|nr:hypothetical protein [Lachnospiraceae bacterium]
MDYKSMVNPTYYTAKSTLFMLAGADNNDAKKMIGILNTQNDIQRNNEASNQTVTMSEEDKKALMTGASLAVEARYAALSRYMKAEGCKNLLDIACGYTPRSIYCGREGIDYVGIDVPVVVEDLQKVVKKEGLQKKHPVYAAGDATNAASLKHAADMLDGEILISCEGLTQYLSRNEFEQFLGGIREILRTHGGAWVSSDMGVEYEKFASANMSTPDAVQLYNEARKQTFKASNIYGEGVAYWEASKKQSLIEKNGLKVEKLPFYYDDEDLVLLRNSPAGWRESYLNLLHASTLWKMTVDTDSGSVHASDSAESINNLRIDYKKEGGTLICDVYGRIDTISAPELLEVLENNYNGITNVVINAKKLEYISSAGLRVLLMAVKRVGEGTVKVTNASPSVKEIFETTGFDQMINVE